MSVQLATFTSPKNLQQPIKNVHPFLAAPVKKPQFSPRPVLTAPVAPLALAKNPFQSEKPPNFNLRLPYVSSFPKFPICFLYLPFIFP